MDYFCIISFLHFRQKDYDASIREYIKTIGKLEASFVIQRVSMFVVFMFQETLFQNT